AIVDKVNGITGLNWESKYSKTAELSQKIYIIPPERTRYLSEIVEENKRYDKTVDEQSKIARSLYQLKGAITLLDDTGASS
ncbi:MAG: hypothetical protein JNL32_14045, partial [Candidatus Kapabacteria bacterium]|nr:hypothetical protein [Candidatus Kapabacteria bacterium]